MSATASQPPVLLLHGFFAHPRLLRPWVERLEAAGYECHVPALRGREPHGRSRPASLRELHQAAARARAELDTPPIVIGHSLGGLLAQRLAAHTDTAALVLLASVPPGVLTMQARTLPYFVTRLPAILAGRQIMVPDRAFRAIPFNTLSRVEQDQLVGQMVPDSGRVFRALSFGTPATRVRRGAVTCPVLCVSGTADRSVSARVANRIATRYRAQHQVHPGLPHWIVAGSLVDTVVPPVLDWLASLRLIRSGSATLRLAMTEEGS